MRSATVMLLALALVACEDKSNVAPVAEQPTEAIPFSPLEPAPEVPTSDAPPEIPGQLLEKLAIEREGSFALAEGSELTLPAVVALGNDGLAFAGQAWTRGDLDSAGESRRWIGVVSGKGKARELEFGAGLIHAAISDGRGGALLVGTDGPGSDARAWFGAIDERGKVTSSVVVDRETRSEMVDVLAGHEDGERALLLGNIGVEGWLVSVDARGAIRWQSHVGNGSSAQLLAGVRIPGERGDVLAVGTQPDLGSEAAWWGRLARPADSDERFEQGKFEIEGADPIRTLDAIVWLGDDMGFIALGRAKRAREQAHDQVIAVGLDRNGQPTWTRLLDHFRAMQIYGGTIHPDTPGAAHFVVRIPIGGDEPSALAWIKMNAGVDGILIPRQLAGTAGWESAGFVEGRARSAISAYRRTETGIEWRVLPIDSGYVWEDPRR